MTNDTLEVPSREDLKGVIARGAAENLEPGEYQWKEVRYDQAKINSVFDSYNMRHEEDLDSYAGEDPEDLPEEAQSFLSTAISYASLYPDIGDESPTDLDEASEEFRNLVELSASLEGMAPAGAGTLHKDEHEDIFGEKPHGLGA